MRRVAAVLLMTALVPALLGCSAKKKEASKAQVAGWFKAAAANKKANASTTTTPSRVTTTIPVTTSTVPALVRLAESKAFMDAAAAQRLADQRCQQLSTGKQRPCATPALAPASPTPRTKPKASAKTKTKAKATPQSTALPPGL